MIYIPTEMDYHNFKQYRCALCRGDSVLDSGAVNPDGSKISLPCPACNPTKEFGPIAEIGRQWLMDSSLEKWFPITAEEMGRLKAENLRLKVIISDCLDCSRRLK